MFKLTFFYCSAGSTPVFSATNYTNTMNNESVTIQKALSEGDVFCIVES